jgi:XTP/dITP diphosphohydrolase
VKLLLATSNRGKVLEFRRLFSGLSFKLVTPDELGLKLDVPEIGATYEENARLKAVAYARAGRLVSLADDSGLEVDALGGEPGIMSSRYAGEGAGDADRVARLLAKLEGVPAEKRTARFVCVIAVATPDGKVDFARGSCDGIITGEPMGEKGFGYDPVFLFREYGKTMAELPMEIKNRVSHRGRAAAAVLPLLKRLQKGFPDARSA